jgi:hypothetical protein
MIPSTSTSQMRLLLTLRDQTRPLLTEEAAHVADTAHLGALRAELRASYQRYLRTYGPINCYKTHATGKVDPHTKEPAIRPAPTRARSACSSRTPWGRWCSA